MHDGHIHSGTSDHLSDIQINGRFVLYEELAEYYYLFARKDRLTDSSIQSEVDYHIGNIVLLSLYFDYVLIQTATLFNSSDPFVRKVIEGVLRSSKFREMLDLNVLKIVGWGGNSPREMFQAAHEFTICANPAGEDKEYFSVIASAFNAESVVSRSHQIPDYGIERLFYRRLEQTTIIRSMDEFNLVSNAVERSMESVGQLVAVSFHPELGKLRLSASALSAVQVSFIQSWHDHLATEIPGVAVYAPLTKVVYVNQRAYMDECEIRTFLYCPQIFASFLGGYISSRDFDKILCSPYSKLTEVKNGDWQRFCEAYHKALAIVSTEIGHLNYSEMSNENYRNRSNWSEKLVEVIQSDAHVADVNAFVESLAMLSGVVLSIPYLGPAMRLIGNLVGRRINETFTAIRSNASAEISPFIRKLQRRYELAKGRA